MRSCKDQRRKFGRHNQLEKRWYDQRAKTYTKLRCAVAQSEQRCFKAAQVLQVCEQRLN